MAIMYDPQTGAATNTWEEPLWATALNTMPGITKSAALTSMRGSRTIRMGGRADRKLRRMAEGAKNGFRGPVTWQEMADQTLGRRHFFRQGPFGAYTTVGIFDQAEKRYSPFNASRMINGAYRKGGNILQKHILPRMTSRITEASNPTSLIGRMQSADFNSPIVEAGALSKMKAGADILAGKSYNAQAMNTYFDTVGSSLRMTETMSKIEAAQMTTATIGGKLTGRVAGFNMTAAGRGKVFNPKLMDRAYSFPVGLDPEGLGGKFIDKGLATESWQAGSRFATKAIAPLYDAAGRELGEKLGTKVAGAAAKKMVMKGFEEGGMNLAAKAGLKAGASMGALAIGQAIPVVDLAMDAWLIASLVHSGFKLIGSAAGKAVKTAGEASQSYFSGFNKPVFGGYYKETAASMTSRQRGVTAISNSRLNARSALGSEAGAFFQHFG